MSVASEKWKTHIQAQEGEVMTSIEKTRRPSIQTLGNTAILNRRMIALFCSAKCPKTDPRHL